MPKVPEKGKPERLTVRIYDGITPIYSVKITVERVGATWFQTGGPKVIELTATRQLHITKVAIQPPSEVKVFGFSECVLPLGFSHIVEKGDTATITLPERLLDIKDNGAR